MEEWLILELRQEIFKMSLECLVVPESKIVFNKQNKQKTQKPYVDVGMLKGHRSQLKDFLMPKLRQFEQH